MGGHRKHKGQQSQSSGRKNQQQQASQGRQQQKNSKTETQSSAKNPATTEGDQNSATLLNGLGKDPMNVALIVVTVGVVVVMLILIHYTAGFFSDGDGLDRVGKDVLFKNRRVTTLDAEIASGNYFSDASHSFLNDRVPGSTVHVSEPLGKDSVNPHGASLHFDIDIAMTERTVEPSLCKDGVTMGFSDWATLKAAVEEANTLSAERFLRWNEYFASVGGQHFGAFEDGSLYYEEDQLFTICPGVTLKSRRAGAIYINAENVIIECEYCSIDVRGTHFAFGPHAKNVLVRGITFRGAHTSSLTFYHDGSEAAFEDCYWTGNSGNGKVGAVADVNSSSIVTFYRCEIADTKYIPRAGQSGVASSLTIRGNNNNNG